MDLSRRGFIKLSAGAADAPRLLAQVGAPAPLGFNPVDASLKYELVIANGDVLDPVQKNRAKRDIGIRFGQWTRAATSGRGPGSWCRC